MLLLLGLMVVLGLEVVLGLIGLVILFGLMALLGLMVVLGLMLLLGLMVGLGWARDRFFIRITQPGDPKHNQAKFRDSSLHAFFIGITEAGRNTIK